MIILITGASHTGKTLLAQRLLEKYHYPYLSIDHPSWHDGDYAHSESSPFLDDQTLTEFLWPIVREMIKTAIENGQNLIVEGCYIPFDWAKDFEADELSQIKSYRLIMSEAYIRKHFADIKAHANAIEQRVDDTWCTLDSVLRDNARQLAQAKQAGVNYLLIQDDYQLDIDL